jgi:hypothetical protein
MTGADRNRIASPFSLREKVADEVGRMREPSDGEGAPRRQTLTPNPSPVGEGGSRVCPRVLAPYVSGLWAGWSVAATLAGSPLPKTVGFATALTLLPQGEGGWQSPPDEGAASRNPHPQPLCPRRGELAGCGRAGSPSLLPRGEGGGTSPTDEGVARKSALARANPHSRSLSRRRGEAR